MLHGPFDYPLLYLLVGALLLLLGRRLFWLFIAGAGFLAGLELAQAVFPHQPEMFVLILAVVLGLLGALLAIFVQKIAVALAGFLAGGYLAGLLVSSATALTHHSAAAWPVAFLVGGIVGAIVMMGFFNWALMILSSLQGAHFIVRGLALRHQEGLIVLLVLAVIGIVIQASTYRPAERNK